MITIRIIVVITILFQIYLYRFVVDDEFFMGYSEPMLTKKDITQLLQAFTKVFATKADLTRFATKKDLEKFATKKEMKKQHNEVVQKIDSVQGDIKSIKGDVKAVQYTLNNLSEMTGNILSWTDDIHKEIVMEKLPQRVHRIEKHLGFPLLAD